MAEMEMTNDKKRDMEVPLMSEEAARKQEMRKKRKLEKAEAMKTGQWDRCMFKIVRKNRFCSNGRIAGSDFCGNHVPSDGSAYSKTAQNYKEELRVRVPCPLDGAHTVYAYDLEKHIKVCNKMRQAATMQSLPYYSENINSGSHASVDLAAVAQPVQTEHVVVNEETEIPVDTSNEQQPQEHSGPSTLQEQSLIDRLAALNFADLTARIHAAFDRCVGEISLQKRHHACCDALLAEKTTAKSSKNVLRHIEQQASILGNMDEVHLLDDANTAFLELGAGRGMLSLAMAQALPSNLYVLIDRAGGRGKADHFIREVGNSGQPQPRVIRAKIDIRHLNLAGFDELADLPVVGMSKHLCGVATDLSLRSLHTLPKPKAMEGNDNMLSPVFKGIAVALCCHHACSWDDYVSPEFFLAQGFTAQEFALVASMTSWATCAMAVTGDSVEYVLGISQANRAVLGRKCKRILDAGRVDYLKKLGLQSKLVHYCDVEESVENCLLLAWTASCSE